MCQAAPAGYPFRQSDYISQLFVLGDVQLATGTCGCWQGGDSSGVFGGLRTPIYLFRSTDGGATWAQVNLAGVLGDVNGQISDIVEHDGAMVLTATTTDAATVAPTVVNVLRSTNGATWERIGTVASDPGAPGAGARLRSLLARLRAGALWRRHGLRLRRIDAIQNIGPAYQTRFWTSTDGGANWTAVAHRHRPRHRPPCAPGCDHVRRLGHPGRDRHVREQPAPRDGRR